MFIIKYTDNSVKISKEKCLREEKGDKHVDIFPFDQSEGEPSSVKYP
jgi:hypothetical protein